MKNLSKNPWFTISAALLASILGYGVHAARAGGIPPTDALTYAGLLEDGTGAALTGSHNIEVKVWDAATAGNQLCDVNPGAAMSMPDGRFQIQLTDDCTTGVHANATTWTEVFLDGTSLGRSANGAVPYAAEAQHAVVADTASASTNATNASNAASGSALAQAMSKLQAQVFVKGSNNGTVSCDSWCENPNSGGPGINQSGTCVGALNLQTSQYRACSETGLAAPAVFCYCSRYGD